jgi:hypothetical protein
LVVPGLESMAPILQQLITESGAVDNYAEVVGDTIRLHAGGSKLTSNSDITLQETAAAEYINMIVRHAISGDQGKGVTPDHFVRKELRRLFEIAQEQITPDHFLPEEIKRAVRRSVR